MTTSTTRRQFLRGAGGALMAIPFLPSLMSRAFAAESAPAAPPRYFFAVGTDHGNIWGANMYPDDVLLTQETSYAGRVVRYGDLPTAANAQGRVSLSPVCSASATQLTPALIGKLNIIRGLDIPYRISHHTGGHLGNFAGTVGNVTAGVDNTAFMAPTADQVLAWAPGFYSAEDLSTRMTQRSFNVLSGALSQNYTSPSSRKGRIVPQPAHVRNHDLFRYFFDPGSALNGVDGFVVDRVKEGYARLRQHPRLSAGDRLRLDAHVERMAEIERKLGVIAQLGAPPAAPSTDSNIYWEHHSFPHDPVENALYCHLMNDIIVAAFSTGVCRVGTWYQTIHFASQLISDWHGQVAHEGYGAAAAQAWALGYVQGTFEHVIVDLAAKMDAVSMQDGSTLLDSSLLLFTQEAGQLTHHSGCVNFPLVTFGRAGGAMNTGLFVDFSDKSIIYDDLDELIAQNPAFQRESPGLYYNQFLHNALCALGVAPEHIPSSVDFGSGEPTAGFGMHYVDPSRSAHYAAARAVMSDPLPVLMS